MDATTPSSGGKAPTGASARIEAALARYGPPAAGYGIPFLLVFGLALGKGGYDTVLRGQAGVIVWWILLLGLALSILPVARLPRQAWLGLGALAAFGAWTVAGLFWTESAERTVGEVTRVMTLLGVFALALFAQQRHGLRRTVSAVGVAVALVAAIALLSRLVPSLLSEFDAGNLLPESRYRLSQPLGYWNGLGALLAIGMPLVLWAASHGRTVVFRALAAASVPLLAAALYYTVSRGGIGAALLAVAALLALHPRRLELVVKSAPAALGSVVVLYAAGRRPELADGITGAAWDRQAREMLLILPIVFIGVALTQVALTLAERYELGPRFRPSRKAALVAVAIFAAALGLTFLVADGPHRTNSTWQTFKSEGGTGSGHARLDSSSGNGRYQYWQSALDAQATRPLTGRGAGSFEYWWSRNATVPGFVRHAHSLYFQVLAETGVVGFALILLLFGTILAAGLKQALWRGSTQRRSLAAAVTAGFLAFAAGAAVDWSWEMTVLPVAALLLAAAVLGPDALSRRRRQSRFKPLRNRQATSIAVAAVAVPCLVLLLSSVTGGRLLERSENQYRAGDVPGALKSARAAAAIQPYAASPLMQQALVLDSAGSPRRALSAAREATRKEPTNWRTWFVRMNAAARAARPQEAVQSYRRTARLHPESRLFESAAPPAAAPTVESTE